MRNIILEDESLRDGLQFEKIVVPLEEKLALFNQLKVAGVQRIQVGSFVNPKIVPQMADADAFVAQVINTPGVLVTGLVLNERGLDRAAACGLKHISLSVSASDSHSMKNVRKSVNDAMQSVTNLIKKATEAGITVRAGVQCAFGCVYEGEISDDKVVHILSLMADAGAQEFNLADTTGMANPAQISQLVTRAKETLPQAVLSLHLHDTRGLGMVNMITGYNAGVNIFDTSVGGLGGCPFVKGAAGNVATEDAVNMFEAIGATTNINLQKLCEVVDRYENILGKTLPGRMSRVLKTQRA